MAVKVGDTVRYLNAVGGGRVTRIVDGVAYVDDEGFETPVLVKECVVVGNSPAFSGNISAPVKDKTPAPTQKKAADVAPTKLPVVETAGGNTLNLVIGFEPVDIKALSQSSFEAYIVNDSNYYLFVSIMSRSADTDLWTPRYDGVIEPNIQEFAFELQQSDLSDFDRLCVQYVALKRDREFEAKQPGSLELKVDATKFAKLHCFRPNPYFDSPVIAFDININDRIPAPMPLLDSEDLARGMKEKKRQVDSQARKEKLSATLRSGKPQNDIIEVDLHADELLDTTAGLSPADILNLQIDKFSQVMDANLRRPGQRIVFIHGKGEGVLRQAIMKELTHRYKGHDVQDASFREYGFGATQVTIRPIPQASAPSSGKKRHK